MSAPDLYDDMRDAIRRIYSTHKGRYGYRRVTAQQRSEGIVINHKTAQWLMVEMVPYGKRSKSGYKSYRGEVGRIAPNIINRDLMATAP